MHNEDEASNFPDDVIVFWPTETTEIAVEVVLSFYIGFEEHQTTVEELNINTPITLEDVVNEWENVSLFWQSLDPRERTGFQRWVIREGLEE